MSLVIRCPRCRRRILFADESIGQHGQCPGCERVLLIQRQFPFATIALIAGGVLFALVTIPLVVVAAHWIRNSSSGESGDSTVAEVRDDHADGLPSATLVSFTGEAAESIDGEIDTSSDTDVFELPATDFTQMTVRVARSSGSSLKPMVDILDANGEPIEMPEARETSARFEATFAVESGQSFFVEVTGKDDSTGSYSLTITPSMDIGDDELAARRVRLALNDRVVINSKFDGPLDVDMFRIDVAQVGRLVVDLRKTGESEVDTTLDLWDEEHVGELANDDFPTLDRDSRIFLDVLAGETFFAKAETYNNSTSGDYEIVFSLQPIEPPDQFSNAVSLDVGLLATAYSSGQLADSSDEDFYYFVAPLTGLLGVEITRTLGSELDPQVYVYDQEGNQIEFNDDYGEGLDSYTTIDVTEWQLYYIKVAAYANSGGYDLFLGPATEDDLQAPAPDPFSDDASAPPAPDEPPPNLAGGEEDLLFQEAIELNLNAPQALERTIATIGDIHCFPLIIDENGTIDIRADRLGGSTLDPAITIVDENADVVATNDDIEFGTNVNSQLEHDVEAGASLFLCITASDVAVSGTETGAYRMRISLRSR